MKRLCALILALMLLLSATALASVTPGMDKTESIRAGETVNVTVTLDEDIENAYMLEYRLYFDDELFDYSYEKSTTCEDDHLTLSVKTMTDKDGKPYVLIQYFDMAASGKTLKASTLATLSFIAAAEIDVDSAATFELMNKYAFNTDSETITGDSVAVPADKAKMSLTVQPAPIAVETVTLDQESAVMILGGDALTLTATVAPEEAEDKTVTWMTSDDQVATVADGVVTAVGVGTAKITATAGEKSASCTVTVKRSATEGYTVELVEDQSINYGGEANVSIKVGVGASDTRTTYNAADITLKYDKEKLSYTGEKKIGDVRISDNAEEGTLTLVRYGSNVNAGEKLVTLKFTAKAAGEAKVEFVSAKVDESANAITKDAPEATKINDAVTITISGHKVNLGDHFIGDAYVTPGKDYTFTTKDAEHFDYADVKATISENEIEVTDNGDGTYTIKSDDITGDVTITATVTGKKYDVTYDGTGKDDVSEAAAQAQYGVDYTFKVNKQSGYTYTVTANVALTDNDDGTYTIAGSEITQSITVTVTRTEGSVTPPTPAGQTVITITGVTEDEVEGGLSQTATNGEDFKLTLKKDAAYDYVVKVGETEIKPNEDGTYTLSGSLLTGDPLTVTITKTVATPEVEVYEYLKLKETEGELSGKSMWLVLVSGKPVDGNVYTFNDNLMFTSEKYDGAYCYLMISEKTIEEVKAEAAALVSQKTGTASAVSYDGDVNMTKVVDVNDAQLVYDMYQARYTAFTDTLTVESFLRADMDGSKSIAVKDAAEIVTKIHSEFAVEAE